MQFSNTETDEYGVIMTTEEIPIEVACSRYFSQMRFTLARTFMAKTPSGQHTLATAESKATPRRERF